MKALKKTVAAITVAAAILTGLNASAQSTANKLRFGVGVDGLVPLDGLSSASFGLGVTPRVQYSLDDKFALTFTSGIYHFFTQSKVVSIGGFTYTEQNDLDVVPVKVGIKGFLWPNVYLAAEVGAAFKVDNGGGWVKPIAAPGVGYATKKWDLSFRYENFSNRGYAISMFALRAAYGIGL